MANSRAAFCLLYVTLAAAAEWTQEDDASVRRHYLIIDAGSSGSRLRMYTSQAGALSPLLPHKADQEDFETEPGLSSYAAAPSEAGPSLRQLLDAAKRYIPKEARAEAHLWVKATAGMRIVEPAVLRQVFGAVDEYLLKHKDNPFKFIASEVLGGEEEAVFAFLSLNHMLGRVDSVCTNCAGVMDMGGASMQIAFRPKHGDILANEFSYYVHQERQSVYAKSFIKFGIEESVVRLKRSMVHQDLMERRGGARRDEAPHLVRYPCYNLGYSEVTEIDGVAYNFSGSGESDECERLSFKLLHTDYECMLDPCPIMGTHMSSVDGLPFFAICGFFYVTAGLGLVGWDELKVVTPREILAATHALCRRDKQEALANSGAPWKYLKNFCFGGHHIRHVLRAFGFPDDSQAVTFVRKMPSGGLADWTQGAALFETQYMPLWLSSRAEPCAEPGRPAASGKWQSPAVAGPPPQLKLTWSSEPRGLVDGSGGAVAKLQPMLGFGGMCLAAAAALAGLLHLARTWSTTQHWQALPLTATETCASPVASDGCGGDQELQRDMARQLTR